MADVKLFRLTTGEDVIGKIKEEIFDENGISTHVILEKPFAIIPQQEAPGKPVKLMLSPYIPYGDCSEVDIKSASIIAEVEPVTDIKNSYNQHTGAGVVEVPKPQLIT